MLGTLGEVERLKMRQLDVTSIRADAQSTSTERQLRPGLIAAPKPGMQREADLVPNRHGIKIEMITAQIPNKRETKRRNTGAHYTTIKP